jgi:hypothetical protein
MLAISKCGITVGLLALTGWDRLEKRAWISRVAVKLGERNQGIFNSAVRFASAYCNGLGYTLTMVLHEVGRDDAAAATVDARGRRLITSALGSAEGSKWQVMGEFHPSSSGDGSGGAAGEGGYRFEYCGDAVHPELEGKGKIALKGLDVLGNCSGTTQGPGKQVTLCWPLQPKPKE